MLRVRSFPFWGCRSSCIVGWGDWVLSGSSARPSSLPCVPVHRLSMPSSSLGGGVGHRVSGIGVVYTLHGGSVPCHPLSGGCSVVPVSGVTCSTDPPSSSGFSATTFRASSVPVRLVYPGVVLWWCPWVVGPCPLFPRRRIMETRLCWVLHVFPVRRFWGCTWCVCVSLTPLSACQSGGVFRRPDSGKCSAVTLLSRIPVREWRL